MSKLCKPARLICCKCELLPLMVVYPMVFLPADRQCCAYLKSWMLLAPNQLSGAVVFGHSDAPALSSPVFFRKT